MDWNRAAIEIHPVVYIKLASTGWYFSDQALSLSNGLYADPRLSSVDRVREVLPTPTVYRENPFKQPLSIVIDDPDGAIYPVFHSEEWAEGIVKLYVGEGVDWGTYSQVFEGSIIVPGGVAYGEFAVKVNAAAGWIYEDIKIPQKAVSDWVTSESKSKEDYIPIAYGNWSASPVKVICINTTTNQFKICDHSIRSITQVYKNVVTPIAHGGEDLTNATFTLSSADYDKDQDTIYAKFEGKDNAGGGGAMIEHPVDVIEDLLETYCGATGKIDAASFAAAKTALTNDHGITKCRRFITDRALAMWYIMQLCDECGLDLIQKNGVFYLYVQAYSPTAAGTHKIAETDIVKGAWSVQHDPQDVYANRLAYKYKYYPCDGAWGTVGTANNAVEQAAVGRVFEKDYEFWWLYDETLFGGGKHPISERIKTILNLLSSRIQVITTELKYRAYPYAIGDVVGVTFRQFSGEAFQIRGISRTFGGSPRVVVDLWKVYNYPKNSTIP